VSEPAQTDVNEGEHEPRKSIRIELRARGSAIASKMRSGALKAPAAVSALPGKAKLAGGRARSLLTKPVKAEGDLKNGQGADESHPASAQATTSTHARLVAVGTAMGLRCKK
jgi:hypothetical protein